MAQIQSGDSSDLLKVEPLSKAARVVVYNPDGSPQAEPAKTGSYIARIEVLPTTVTAGTAFWSMRNTGAKKAMITALELMLSFIGTSAASRSIFEIVRFNTATPVGGTQIVATKINTLTDANPDVTDIRFNPAGLTVTGVNFETQPFEQFAITNQITVAQVNIIEFNRPIILNSGEGIAIRANTALVAGAGVVGNVRWFETL